MVTKKMTINIPSGLAARPAAILVQVASQYESSIYIECEEKKINGKTDTDVEREGIVYVDDKNGWYTYQKSLKIFEITKNTFRYYNSIHINQTITPLLQFDIRHVCNIKISTNKMLKLKYDKIVFAFVIYLDYSNNEFFEFGVDDLNIGVDFIKVLTLIMNYHEDMNN